MRDRSVHVVGADVDGAQAQAAAGLNHLLLIAVADAGVDIEAAEAEAVAPAAVMTPAAAMKAMRGSGSGSQRGNAERSCGDQSKSNLAKHCLVSSVLALGRCCVPARLSDRLRGAFKRPEKIRVSGMFRGDEARHLWGMGRSRVPDAVQRFFCAAPQSREPLDENVAWTPDSAAHRKSAAQHPGNVPRYQNFGGRFSANARMPSLISALRMLSRWRRSAATSSSLPRANSLIARFMPRIATGALPARMPAS